MRAWKESVTRYRKYGLDIPWKFPHQQVVGYRCLARHLLHEKWDAGTSTYVSHVSGPLRCHQSRRRSTLAAHDYPVRHHAIIIDVVDLTDSWLIADELHHRWRP